MLPEKTVRTAPVPSSRVRDEVKARDFPIPAQRTIIDYASLGGEAG